MWIPYDRISHNSKMVTDVAMYKFCQFRCWGRIEFKEREGNSGKEELCQLG